MDNKAGNWASQGRLPSCGQRKGLVTERLTEVRGQVGWVQQMMKSPWLLDGEMIKTGNLVRTGAPAKDTF